MVGREGGYNSPRVQNTPHVISEPGIYVNSFCVYYRLLSWAGIRTVIQNNMYKDLDSKIFLEVNWIRNSFYKNVLDIEIYFVVGQ